MIELVYPVEILAPLVPAVSSASASRRKKSENREMFPIVREDGTVVARAERSYCHSAAAPLHPVVHLHVIDRQQHLYLQKRSRNKDIQPGKWDTSVGGHVIYGESIMEALFREAAEELGLKNFNPVYLGSYVSESDIEKELVNIFVIVGGFSPVPDGDEVEEGRWWTFKEIDKALRNGIFTPNFVLEFKKIRKQLLSLL